MKTAHRPSKHQNKRRWRAAALALAASIGCASAASADVLLRAGPTDPANGFPSYLMDPSGLALQLCLLGDGATGICRFDPATSFPTNTVAQLQGFGNEASYLWAQATLPAVGGRRSTLTVGLHAGFQGALPAAGAQQVISRVNYRVATPGPGYYRVYHPFMAYPACQPDVHRVPVGGPLVINHTRQTANAMPVRSIMDSPQGTLLRWDPAVAPAAPAGFVGDPAVLHPVVGSPCGVNTFRVEGPNIGGAGLSTLSSNQFSLAGRVAPAVAPASVVVVDRASYDRSNPPGPVRFSVYGRANPGSTVTMGAAPGVSPALTAQADAAGRFLIQFGAGVSPPTVVVITGSDGSQTQVLATDTLDNVSAVYAAAARTLTVRARSSDRATITTLTVAVGGTQTAMVRNATTGEFSVTLNGIATPPPSVTVTSSRGGQITAPVAD